MENEQTIINGLYEKRSIIERECSGVRDELDRLALIMSGYKDRLGAIDKVIAEFGGHNDSDIESSFSDAVVNKKSEIPHKEPLVDEQESLVDDDTDSEEHSKQVANNSNGSDKLITKGRSSNFRGLVRKEFPNLPSLFTKNDVIKLMENSYPELKGNININTMSGAMRSLVKNGLAKVRHKSTGTSSQVYEKKV